MIGLALALAAALLIAAPPPAEAAKRGPVDATVSVDAKRARSALITVAGGGKLSVTAPNGTKITVKFPPGAVPENTRVTATPVKKLASRITRKGLLGGVQLEPDGLQLRKPATVRFARKGKAAKGTRLVFVGTEGDGDDVHRLPPPVRRKGSRLVPTGKPVVSITHFSTVDGFDWSKATVSQINAILYPAVGVHRLSEEMSRLIADETTTAADLAAAFNRAHKELVEPVTSLATQALRGSCSVKALRGAKTALALGIGFTRQAQLLGMDFDGPLGLLEEAGRCAVKLCPTLGDPTAATFLFGISRQMQLLGAGSDAFHEALGENLKRCGVFEVRLDSQIDVTHPSGGFSFRVTGVVKIVPYVASLEPDRPSPRGPLEYKAVSGSFTDDCEHTTIVGTKNGLFQVTNVDLVTFDPDKPASNPVRSLELAIIGLPTETYHTTVSAPCTYTQEDFEIGQWFNGFSLQHPEYMFAGSDFLPDEPPVFAIAVYGPNTKPYLFYEAGTVSENTKIEIVHTPEPPEPMPDA